jgi:hypothetical protein
MNGGMHREIYNLRIDILGMLVPLPRWLRFACSLLIVCLCTIAASATDWTAAEAQLAGKIAGVTGPGAVALDVTNRSSLATADVQQIRRGLEVQMGALGLRFVNAEQAAATIRISLSEDVENYVWVGEIHQGTNQAWVVMVSLPRPQGELVAHSAGVISIHKALLWLQADPILDVAVIDGNPTDMAVLSPDRITLYRLQQSHWQLEQTLPIAHSHPWPRDLRGRLMLRKDHLLDAYLPGVFCKSTANSPLALTCRESDDPWPLAPDPFALSAFFTPARNFFTGALAPGIGKLSTAPAFYSAAPIPRERYTLWLFAATDGSAHLMDGMSDQTAGRLNWGSDIISLRTGCGSGWQILAAQGGEGATDAVRAFEIPDREPLPASQPVEFNGAITALWTETNGEMAIAVSHNSATGNYEAYRLSTTCGQ